MNGFAALFLLATIPHEPIERDRVCVQEVNTFHDEACKPVFEQQLFWRWYPRSEAHHVIAWRVKKHPSQEPRFDYATGEWVTLWFDGEVLREVRAKIARKTASQSDPEREDQEHLAKDKRTDLSKPVRGRE